MPSTKIYADNTFTTITQVLASGSPGYTAVTVEDGAYVLPSAVGSDAFVLSSGVWTFNLNGVIESQGDGIVLVDSGSAKNSKLTVGATGSLYALDSTADGLDAHQVTDVTNSGDIFGGHDGIELSGVSSGSKGFTIVNNAGATITGGDVGVDDSIAGITMTLKNAGAIATSGGPSAITFAGAALITNSGTIAGNILSTNPGSLFADTLTNSGVITSSIRFDDGNDTVTNAKTGTIGGSVELLDGNNKVTNSGITGSIFTGSGNDSVTNAGSVQGVVSLGGGNNTFTNTGTVNGDVSSGIGNTMLKNSGEIDGTVQLSDANDSFTNSQLILGAVSLGGGTDTGTNSGTLVAALDLGDGDNKFTNTGTMDALTAGSGNDLITNSGTIAGLLTLGGGNNSLTNSGHIEVLSGFGKGNDTVTNTGTISDVLDLGAGDNKVTSSGDIAFGIEAGGGNDVVTSTGAVGAGIDLGGGNDSLITGNGSEYVIDDSGNDSYKLGGGDDIFRQLGKGNITLDGGAGNDLLELFFDKSDSYVVNLGTSSAVVFGNTIAANSSFTAGTHIGGSVKNFEQANGTNNGDTLVGTNGANFLSGGGGPDVIAGGLGADMLVGGAGTDTFYYFSAKDSGLTKTTWDRILDFQSGTDVIDLAAIDASTKVAGDQAFAFIGDNTPFHHLAGEVRAVTEGNDTIVQGDTNGDGKADFAIDLVGIAGISSSDIVG